MSLSYLVWSQNEQPIFKTQNWCLLHEYALRLCLSMQPAQIAAGPGAPKLAA